MLESAMTLKQELDSFAAGFAQQMPADIVHAFQQSIDKVKDSGIVERALKAGDPIRREDIA